jgi:hypothetical protein
MKQKVDIVVVSWFLAIGGVDFFFLFLRRVIDQPRFLILTVLFPIGQRGLTGPSFSIVDTDQSSLTIIISTA